MFSKDKRMRKEKCSAPRPHSEPILERQKNDGFTAQQFQDIFNEIQHGIAIVDSDSHIVFVNDTFCELLKLTKSEQDHLLGKEITDLYLDNFVTLYLEHIYNSAL